MFVKICATTTLEDARLALDAGADALGFVFAPSKRQMTPGQVAAITRELPADTVCAGVFATQDAGEIMAAADEARLQIVQLHSEYSVELVRALHAARPALRLVQVVSIAAGSEMPAQGLREQLRAIWAEPPVYAVLLDAAQGGASGGLGVAFDWSAVAGAVREAKESSGGRLIVAGGLRTENVTQAIATFAPYGVDVASGVEALPGHKDAAKVAAFVRAARTATS